MTARWPSPTTTFAFPLRPDTGATSRSRSSLILCRSLLQGVDDDVVDRHLARVELQSDEFNSRFERVAAVVQQAQRLRRQLYARGDRGADHHRLRVFGSHGELEVVPALQLSQVD